MQKLFIFLLIILITPQCQISFRVYDLDPEIKTFAVDQFETQAGNAPPTLGQQFSEFLKQRILNTTKLNYINQKGDIEFSGKVTGYKITPIAPKDQSSVSLQRLTISMQVDFDNKLKKEDSWSNDFRRFADFSADANLADVEEALVEEIYDQIIEDVFNKAFSNW